MSNGELDIASLIDFVGSGTGVISRWYNQSAESQGDLLSKTNAAFSEKPVIVENGSLVTDNGKPAIHFREGSVLISPQNSDVCHISNRSERLLFMVLSEIVATSSVRNCLLSFGKEPGYSPSGATPDYTNYALTSKYYGGNSANSVNNFSIHYGADIGNNEYRYWDTGQAVDSTQKYLLSVFYNNSLRRQYWRTNKVLVNTQDFFDVDLKTEETPLVLNDLLGQSGELSGFTSNYKCQEILIWGNEDFRDSWRLPGIWQTQYLEEIETLLNEYYNID